MSERSEGFMVSCGRGFDTPSHALPGDGAVWPRDRGASIKHMKIEVNLDVAAKSVSGTVTHTAVAFNDGLKELVLDAVDMNIVRVQLNPKRGRFAYDGTQLRVRLPQSVKRGHEFEVAVTYSATPRLGLYFVGPDEGYPEKPRQAWTQGQDEDSKYWFPCYDNPNNKQTTEMIATVPESWYALSNGDLLSDTENGDGTRTFHWSQTRPHSTYLIILAAGEFARIDASRPHLTVDYFVEEADLERGEITFKNTPAMIDLFEDVTGVAFPWAKYSQIVLRDFVFGGMENTSATSMTENILIDKKAARDTTMDGLVSHELAHMWWGDLLTCRDWSHGWLNEGFATYAEQLWVERSKGTDEYCQGILDKTGSYLLERYRRPIVTNVYNEPIDVFDRHLYEKGGLVLHTLRGVLGEDQFFRSMRRYVADNQDQVVITQDLVNAIEDETGRNMEWFFDQWVYKPGHPKLEVSWSWDADNKLATVAVKQTQSDKDGPKAFRIPTVIDFQVEGRKPQRFPVEITEREHTFVFPVEAKPDLCRFDPGNSTLKELTFKKPVKELIYQLRHDEEVAGRAFAAASLGKNSSPEAIVALERAVVGDRFWGVQVAAATGLGTAKTEQARDALLRCVKVRHLKTRRSVATELGNFLGDETVFEALKRMAAEGRSYFVESAANQSLGKLRVPGSFKAICANIGRASYREVVRLGSIEGLVELRDERGLDVIRASAVYGAPQATRAAAVRALASLAMNLDRPPAGLGQEIASFLDDPDFRVRMAAMGALRTLKEPKWAGRIESQIDREQDGRAVRTARTMAAELRRGADESEEVKRIREQLEELRRDQTKLLSRIETIDARNGS